MAASPPVALVLHGSGSTAEFALRALGPGLRTAGYAPVALDLRTGDVAKWRPPWTRPSAPRCG